MSDKIMNKIKAPVISNDPVYLQMYVRSFPNGYFLRHCETALPNHDCPYIEFGCKHCIIKRTK